ncbi:hypothetical protein Dd1591_1136 [Dickeya chrysanthemi Ech1591]|uniref:Uncharacterized protein n=2 Tax=Dickeya TaxID=204037 RepID=C6CPF3_DICC1|nr:MULTISPECIES: hypothetical protein [Dickeya]ACT06008.1 hypothetical protein Dd1591_1136 [Dickeya chrysanthemi Ech1591]MCA6992274.1 hypothetical protein [Dickeya oryzae]
MSELLTNHPFIIRHPILWVTNLIENQIKNSIVSSSISLTFSKYRYLPQSFTDERYIFSLPIWQLNEQTLLDMIANLQHGEELALHSQLFDFGSEHHIPLIDFGNVDRGIIDSTPLRDLASHWNLSFYIFNSGRSFHAYGNRLIKNHEWIKFMGSLLLLNKPSGFKLIDERWVGHRIMAGYSALRWSCNTTHYKKKPTYVGYLNPYGLFMEK